VVLKFGSIKPWGWMEGFDGAVSGVHRRSSEIWLKALVYSTVELNIHC